jgi:hypothetical protein
MKFQPTSEEQTVGNAHTDEGPYDLNSAALAVSGSEWMDIHLKALRVVLLDGLPLSRLFPSEYLPSDSHPGEFGVKCREKRLSNHLQYTMIGRARETYSELWILLSPPVSTKVKIPGENFCCIKYQFRPLLIRFLRDFSFL